MRIDSCDVQRVLFSLAYLHSPLRPMDNLEMTEADGRISISVELRIGGGTDRPADGFSLNFVRPNDPLLSGDGDGYAGIGSETNLPEEGSTTGLSIGFDEWQNGPAPDPADPITNTTNDVVGISIRFDGQILAQASLPTLNGDLSDPTSLQTGPNSGLADLGWATLTLDAPSLETGGQGVGFGLSDITITWKGQSVEFIPLPEPSSGPLA